MDGDSLLQPQDKLFKAGIENPATARSFFEQHLAPEIFHALDWESLNEMRRIFSRIENKELRSKSRSVAEQFIEEGLQEGLQKGRQEGEWIGKIQPMEQFLGRELTPRKEFEGCGVECTAFSFECEGLAGRLKEQKLPDMEGSWSYGRVG